MIEFEVISHGMRLTEREPSSKRTVALRMVSNHEVVIYLPVSIPQLFEFPLGSRMVLTRPDAPKVRLLPAELPETQIESAIRITEAHK